MTYKNEEKYNIKNDLYECNYCYYNTSNKSNYNRHLISNKHIKRVNTYEILTKTTNMTNYVCDCGKLYKHRQSLYNHRKNCKLDNIQLFNENTNIIKEKDTKILILEKENEVLKLKNEIIRLTKDNEFMKQSFNIKCNNNYINSFNNKNEIKIFLSEQCSNALSVHDFVKQLTITLDDLMKTKDNTVKGITNIIERNLKPLTLTDRPVHYIKKDEWFLKDKEGWKEDDGDTLVDKTHEKIQKDCIDRYIKDEISNLQEDEALELLSLITKELEHKNKIKIKEELSNNCVLRNKKNE
jgi:hypothetical protein